MVGGGRNDSISRKCGGFLVTMPLLPSPAALNSNSVTPDVLNYVLIVYPLIAHYVFHSF